MRAEAILPARTETGGLRPGRWSRSDHHSLDVQSSRYTPPARSDGARTINGLDLPEGYGLMGPAGNEQQGAAMLERRGTAPRATKPLGDEIAPLPALLETVDQVSGRAEATNLAKDYARRAEVLTQSAAQAKAGGNTTMARAYEKAASNYMLAVGEADRAGTSFIDGASIPRAVVNPPEFKLSSGWSYMGQNSIGYVQGRGILPDYQTFGGGVNTMAGTMSTNLHDGSVAYGGGVVVSNTDPGMRPAPSYSVGWVFGAKDAKSVTEFMTGSGTQFGILIPTPWKISPSIMLNHSYGGSWALELGIAPGSRKPMFVYQSFGHAEKLEK